MMNEVQLDTVAKAIYMANWKELPNNRFPPVWENTSEEVKNFTRRQAQRAYDAFRNL